MKPQPQKLLGFVCLALAWLTYGSLPAQENYGQIVGRVEDRTGAVIDRPAAESPWLAVRFVRMLARTYSDSRGRGSFMVSTLMVLLRLSRPSTYSRVAVLKKSCSRV